MNRIHVHARRLAGLLAALTGTLLALVAGAPAAFALPQPIPLPGGGPRSPAPAGAHPAAAPPGGVAFRLAGPAQLAPQQPHPAVAPSAGVFFRLEGPAQLTQPQPHTAVPAHLHAAVTGGMAGWQITLIAIAAALAVATLAVLLGRARTARRRVSPTQA